MRTRFFLTASCLMLLIALIAGCSSSKDSKKDLQGQDVKVTVTERSTTREGTTTEELDEKIESTAVKTLKAVLSTGSSDTSLFTEDAFAQAQKDLPDHTQAKKNSVEATLNYFVGASESDAVIAAEFIQTVDDEKTSGVLYITPEGKVTGFSLDEDTGQAVSVSQRYLPGTSGTFFVLVIGNDERPGVGGARADALHLVGVNTAENKVTILNFPRDTTVSIPGHGRNKINAANAFGGSALTTQTIEELTGVHINYVLEANFAAFTGLIDALGGIDITVEKPMHDRNSGTNFDPGVVHMNGAQALSFSRDRHSFSNGDLQRTVNQGSVLIATVAEMQKTRTSIVSKFEAASSIAKYVTLTNLSSKDVYFLMEQAGELSLDNVTNVLVPWQGSNQLSPRAPELFADFADNAVLDTYK